MKYQVTIKSALNTVMKLKNIGQMRIILNCWKNSIIQMRQMRDTASLTELLLMAISDFEPKEAAVIVLAYKLSEELNEGQIQQISNDMFLDKVCEEYPEIGLHSTLFHVNQLLFKAYNGKFPNAKATIVKCSFAPIR